MSDPHDDNPYHLPLPSAQPLVASLGAAMMLVGLVPDSRLWRMAIISSGAMILGVGVWLWISDAISEYRNLPDE